MKIFRNEQLEKDINQAMRDWIEADERGEFHFSDLLTPRKSFWRKTKPKPLTEAEIGFFIAGRAHHEVIIAALRKQKKMGAPSDERKVWEEVFYTPDYNLNFLAEIKSTRKQSEPRSDNQDELEKQYREYLKQLAQYMAAEKQDIAALIVFFISLRHDSKNKVTIPTLRAYQVELTARERTRKLEEMRETLALLKKALKLKNHKILPLCPPWQCCSGGYKGPAFENCKWYHECKPEGRYPLAAYAEAKQRGDFDDD